MSDIPSALPPSGSPPAPSSSPQQSGQQAGSSQAAPTGGQTTGGQTTGGQTTGGQTAGGQTAGGQTTGGQGGSAQATPQATQQQPAAAQAPSSPARAPELPPDLARAAAGTTVEGQVRQAAADGRVTVRTAQGDVRLELSRAQVAQLLKPGTPVTVEIRNPGTQPPIVQLTVRGAPAGGAPTGNVPGQAPVQPAVTTGTSAPAPTVPLAVGRIVQATVVPGPTAQSAASAAAAQSSQASAPTPQAAAPASAPPAPTPGTPTTPGGAPAPAPSAAVPGAPTPPGAPVVANPGSASTGTTPTGTTPSGIPTAATGSPAAPTVQSGPAAAGSSPAPPAAPTSTTPAGGVPASGSSPQPALAQPATGPAGPAAAASAPTTNATTNAATNATQATPATAAATAQAAGRAALPNGAVLTVRVAAIGEAEARPEGAARAVTGLVQNTAASGTPGRIAGQIAGLTAAGRPVVESPVGNLALDARADLRLGTRIALDVLASRTTAGTGERSAPLAVLAREWPALEATLRVLEEQLGPAGARQAIEAMPRPGPQMTATLLFFMTALRVGDVRAWLGRNATQALERAGQGRLLDSLTDDFKTMQRAADPSETGWRSYLIPVAWDERRPIRLLTRRERRDGRDGRSGKPGTAFLVDLDLTNIGPFRLDGLVRNELLDLLIRTTKPLPTIMRRDIKALFDGTLERTGIVGRLSFKASPVMPPLPVDLDASTAGGTTELTV